jgi:cation diffusion facilitator family transporter
MPEPFTLGVLVVVVAVKEAMARWVLRVGDLLGSSALRADAWHHRSDALTSLAAFAGISIALVGGPGWEAADDWAALVACLVIVWNAINLLQPVLGEVMDAAAPAEVVAEVRAIASSVPGVTAIEKCRVRKSGTSFLTDIHVEVDGDLSVRAGHRIGHDVANALRRSHLRVADVVVHVEPSSPTRGTPRGEQDGPPAANAGGPSASV